MTGAARDTMALMTGSVGLHEALVVDRSGVQRVRKIRTAGVFVGDPNLSESIKFQIRADLKDQEL